jgi:hypothetical protein
MGTVVSGTMIGMKRYYEEVSKTVIETARAKYEKEVSYMRKELQKLFDIIKQLPQRYKIKAVALIMIIYFLKM